MSDRLIADELVRVVVRVEYRPAGKRFARPQVLEADHCMSSRKNALRVNPRSLGEITAELADRIERYAEAREEERDGV